jgi:hypothetical protein
MEDGSSRVDWTAMLPVELITDVRHLVPHRTSSVLTSPSADSRLRRSSLPLLAQQYEQNPPHPPHERLGGEYVAIQLGGRRAASTGRRRCVADQACCVPFRTGLPGAVYCRRLHTDEVLMHSSSTVLRKSSRCSRLPPSPPPLHSLQEGQVSKPSLFFSLCAALTVSSPSCFPPPSSHLFLIRSHLPTASFPHCAQLDQRRRRRSERQVQGLPCCDNLIRRYHEPFVFPPSPFQQASH